MPDRTDDVERTGHSGPGEEGKLSSLPAAGGNIKWYNHFGTSFGMFFTHTSGMESNHSTQSHLSNKNENVCPYKNLAMNTQRSLGLMGWDRNAEEVNELKYCGKALYWNTTEYYSNG